MESIHTMTCTAVEGLQSPLSYLWKLSWGLRMDERNQGYECPKCGNEEIEQGQKYCQICGKPLEWKEADDLSMLLQG